MSSQPRSSRSRAVFRLPLAVASLAAIATLLSLTGCGTPSAPTIITVQGRVVDFIDAVPNADVLVDGKTTTTAADGTFSVTGVHRPYDITLSFQGNSDVWVYEGLTRSDPTVQIFGPGSSHQASITASIGTTAYQSNEVGAVFPGGSAFAYGGAGSSPGSSTIGPDTVGWGSTDPLHTTLYGIRAIVDGSGNPTSYTGYGSLAVTLHDGDTLTGLNVPTSAVSTGALSGSLTAPSGYTLSHGVAVVRFGTASAGALVGLPLANTTPLGTFSNTMMPIAADIGHGLAAAATDGVGDFSGAWGRVTVPNASANLTLPAAAMPTAPASGATNVAPGTAFSWSTLTDSVYVVSIYPQGTPGTHLYIVTSDTSATLPDLSGINRALPTSANYGFTVQTTGPFASMDAAAAPAGMMAIYVDFDILFSGGGGGSGPVGVAGPSAPGWYTGSTESTFTTAP